MGRRRAKVRLRQATQAKIRELKAQPLTCKQCIKCEKCIESSRGYPCRAFVSTAMVKKKRKEEKKLSSKTKDNIEMWVGCFLIVAVFWAMILL